MAQKFYVLNITKEAFLSLGVSKADTTFTRLCGLLGRRRLHPEDGLWIVPSQGIHTFGMLFAIDAVYLNKNERVVEFAEHLSPFRIGPIRTGAHSVIELPLHSIQASQTEIGDQFLILPAEQMVQYLEHREAFQARDAALQEPAKERRKAAGRNAS